jgi:hypothetical protein
MFIKFNSNTGKITNQYYDDVSNINQSDWVEIDESVFPNPTVADNEYVVYFYDPTTGDVTAETKTVEVIQ